MEQFVTNGWAGKDYTHINFAGGRQVALALANALNDGMRREARDRDDRLRRQERARNVADSLREAVRLQLLQPAVDPLTMEE